METITVRSIPLDETQNWLDCSVCGPFATCATVTAHQVALAHLNEHGIDTTEPSP